MAFVDSYLSNAFSLSLSLSLILSHSLFSLFSLSLSLFLALSLARSLSLSLSISLARSLSLSPSLSLSVSIAFFLLYRSIYTSIFSRQPRCASLPAWPGETASPVRRKCQSRAMQDRAGIRVTGSYGPGHGWSWASGRKREWPSRSVLGASSQGESALISALKCVRLKWARHIMSMDAQSEAVQPCSRAFAGRDFGFAATAAW